LSTNTKSNRSYYGRFAIKKISPPYIVKDGGLNEVVDSNTLNIVIPITEVKNLSDALLKAIEDNPDTINIKVELRTSKKRKSDGLSPCTITYSPYD